MNASREMYRKNRLNHTFEVGTLYLLHKFEFILISHEEKKTESANEPDIDGWNVQRCRERQKNCTGGELINLQIRFSRLIEKSVKAAIEFETLAATSSST